MERELRSQDGADELIEGFAGPFYVALNRATFYLLGVIFISMAPLIVFLVRDQPSGVRIAVSIGVAMESGTLVHVYIERVLGMKGPVPWMVHLAVAGVLYIPIYAYLFGF
ncbi:MAG: hypothetical protein HYX50_05790 [Chloroflexi bacterium]|nr:hypothetical protein [Chloroflexota bacterium]